MFISKILDCMHTVHFILTRPIVVYWPQTWPGCQNKKCTYVNKRCIWSRNIRIITLTEDGLNECNCEAHKKVGIKLLYNLVKTGSQLVWRPDQLETRCGRESQHPAEGALRPPINQFRDQTSWRQDAVEKASTQQSGLLGPQLSSPGERERNTVMANRVGVNMLQFCSVSNSLSYTILSNSERYIFLRTVSLVLLCCRYDFACICVCMVGIDNTTLSQFNRYQKNIMLVGLSINGLYPLQKGKISPQKGVSQVWYLTASDGEAWVLESG